jgi:alpha-beta hydrolase superfamily lysophospholipase
MEKACIKLEHIPAVVWGKKTDSVYIYVHGRGGNRDEANRFAETAVKKGFQVLSFDLPEHGERTNEPYPCVVWNGVRDLNIVGEYVSHNWDRVYLFGCSLGAYFSLLAYKDMPLKKCLLLSPVLDMERLIQNMMKWFSVSEEMLKEKREIPTPMGETLNWDYYCHVKNNPVERWNVPTAILYGAEDNMTERKILDVFVRRFDCDLTVLEGGEHYFHTDKQLTFLKEWIGKQI